MGDDKPAYVVRRTGDWWLRYEVLHPNGGEIDLCSTVLGARWIIWRDRRRGRVVYKETA